jgi:hypothetical protein
MTAFLMCAGGIILLTAAVIASSVAKRSPHR